ncbi:MAG: deoxyuridine 5-triphosphate nucleotidohydrolase [Pseudonocardiales bacterium]|nr:deoxyuridine 5-triphosphate nucleotidohydrolase [Pseudonocardiales bacterium]
MRDEPTGVVRDELNAVVRHDLDRDRTDHPGIVVPVNRLRVLVQCLDPEVGLPEYALPGDAGADILTTVGVILAPGERAVLPTGIAIALPDGYAAFVHPRSGLAARVGLSLVNAPGTIDAGYRGEIKVIVINLDPVTPLVLSRGDRIAQLVIQRVEFAEFELAEKLPASHRGEAGHGSTGGSAHLEPEVLDAGTT